MNTVAVLMSTYNGELFLKEQIDSILRQQDVNIYLFIRDDGSCDGTIRILDEYAKKHTNITVYKGENVGVGNSFMKAVKAAGNKADYYALADQDDIWLPEKLIKAIDILKEKTGPCCYCSNQTLVDTQGKILRERHTEPIDTGYKQILCNNKVTGCTMVWNNELQKTLANESFFPSTGLLKKRIHDVWVAIVASVIGDIYYDPHSFILYRQHEKNVVGVRKESIFKLWRQKLNDPALRNGRSMLADEIVQKLDGKIKDQTIHDWLVCCANYHKSLKGIWKLIKNQEIRRYSGEDAFTYTVKVLLGLL